MRTGVVRMFEAAGIAALLLFGVFSGTPQSRPAQDPASRPSGREPAAIGTYDRTEVLIAYYKSPPFREKMRLLHEAHAEAKKNADIGKMKELEGQGEALQERAHRQLAGEAPLTEVMEALEPHFAEIAKAAGIGAIVSDFEWRDPAFKTVDLTARFVEKLGTASK